MRVLVTRPEEDGAALADLLEGRGIEVLLEPLITIAYRDDVEPDLSGIQAILMTSANGVRAFAKASARRELPVYAVGDASARAAREAGFQNVESADGDVEALAKLIAAKLDPGAGPLYHAAGSSLAGDLAGRLGESGFEVRRGVLYDAETARALSPAAVAAIKSGKLDGVLLFSPRTAAAFADLARQARLVKPARDLTAYCLSKAVAEAATDLPWRAVKVAAQPNQDALIALLTEPTGGPAPQAETGASAAGHDEAREEDKDETVAPSDLPQSPAPGVTIVRPSRTRSGLTAFFVSVVVLAVVIGGLAATMPVWVPEFARYLPGQPSPPPDPRVAQLAGRFDAFEKQTREQEQQVAARRAENSQALADLDAERKRLNEQLGAALDRVDMLEKSIAEMRQQVEAAAAAPPANAASDEALKALSDRLAQIEQSGLKASLQDREKIAALTRKVGELEAQSAKRQKAAQTLESHALELAVRHLRLALDGSRPFADELAGLTSVAEGNAEIAQVANILAPYAATGIPTLTDLRGRFEKLAAAISRPVLASSESEGKPGWVDRVLGRLGIKIRRVGKNATGSDAVINLAQTRLDAGDLEGAIAALDGLDAAAKAKAGSWIETARARVDAEHALARLQVLAASQKQAADG